MSFWFCESEGFDAPSWSLKECAIDYDRLVVAFGYLSSLCLLIDDGNRIRNIVSEKGSLFYTQLCTTTTSLLKSRYSTCICTCM